VAPAGRGRIGRPLLCFCLALTAASALVPGAAAQAVPGWRLHTTRHFLVYVVEGTAGAGNVEQVSADLELIHAEVITPLRLPAVRLAYPLYPTLDRFRADWWHFASLGYGEIVHAWGAIYTGDYRAITPYTITRAVVSDAFPRAIPLLRWGLGDALGDRAAGVDAHAHLAATRAAGLGIPHLREILAPADFGARLPMSYPTAVSFMAFLLERYGPERTTAFAERVAYRYYDFPELFALHFGETLSEVEQAWEARVTAARPPRRIDGADYLAASRFVYRVTLAGNPARRMLLPDGPAVVSAALAAAEPLRRLNLGVARGHMEVARRATAEAERQERRTEWGLRGIVYVLVLTPIFLALAWLLWPAIRGRLASGGVIRHG